MSEFLAALSEHAFLQNALLAGLLASVACGVVGTYVVIKRITYLAGAIAHSVLAGLGAARYLQVVHGLSWLTPMMGAVLAALLAGLTMGLVSLRAREREDTVIGAIWALGMALGVLFIASTPGYAVNLMGYLFGNILLVAPADLWLMAILDLAVLAVGLGRYRQLVAVSFDEEFARLRGVAADWYYLLLLGMVALTVVLLTAVVGIVMVIALLTLPAAIAGRLAKRVWQIMAWAVIISMVFTSLGLGLSYQPDLPSGAVIILLAVGAYLAVAIGGKVWKKKRA